jgi:hypothetical protein
MPKPQVAAGKVTLIDNNGLASQLKPDPPGPSFLGGSSVSDSRGCSDCCRHAKEIHHDLTSAIGMAAKLASLLLLADAGPARAPLHVVGHAPEPQEPVRLADVIQFPSRRASPGSRPAARRAAGI